MDNPTDKIIDLEARIAFLERLLDQLNTVVTRQQDQLDAQSKALLKLREQLESAGDDMPADERPPHY